MQRALRAGWPCAWPMVSSLSGYDPAREKAPDAPLLALGLLVTLSCQDERPLARGPIRDNGPKWAGQQAPVLRPPSLAVLIPCQYDREVNGGVPMRYVFVFVLADVVSLLDLALGG